MSVTYGIVEILNDKRGDGLKEGNQTVLLCSDQTTCLQKRSPCIDDSFRVRCRTRPYCCMRVLVGPFGWDTWDELDAKPG